MYKLKEGPKFYNLLRKKTSFTMVRQNRQASCKYLSLTQYVKSTLYWVEDTIILSTMGVRERFDRKGAKLLDTTLVLSRIGLYDSHSDDAIWTRLSGDNIRPSFHWRGGRLSSLMTTILRSSIPGLEPECHLLRIVNSCRYSLCQRLQKCWRNLCTCCQADMRLTGTSVRSI